MSGQHKNKEAMANAPTSQSDMPRPSSRRNKRMSERRKGLGTSHWIFEGGRYSPFFNMSAHDSNVHRNFNGHPPISINYLPTPPGSPSFSATSPGMLRSNTPNEVWCAPSVSNSQLSDLPRPFGAYQDTSRTYQADYISFPRISTPSEYSALDPGTPAPMASSSHVQHLEGFEQVLPTNLFSQASDALPQVHFDHLQQPNHSPSPFTPLLPPGPPPSGPPYTSSSFDQPRLPNSAAVTAYLGEAVWRPSMGMYGVPTTDVQKRYYVRKICLGLVNLYNLWDDPKDLLAAAVKFADTGIWSDSKDIETAAHIVVNTAMRIHNLGVTGIAFRRSAEFESLNAEDMDFTFPQRIHYLARLFYHSKVAADNVMVGRDVAKYVALPLTSLRRLPWFEDEWSSMSQVDRAVQTEIIPYPNGLKHPSQAEQKQLSAHVATMPALVNNYMATGGDQAIFGQKYPPPYDLTYEALLSFQEASHKRSVERDQGPGEEPVAKRFRTSEHASFDSSIWDHQDEEGDCVINAVDTGFTAGGLDTD